MSKLKTFYRHRSIICLTWGWVLKQVKNQTSCIKIWSKAFFFISKLTHRSSLSKLLRLKWFEVEQIEIWPKEIPWASWDGHQSPLWLTLEIFGKLEQIVLRSSWSKEWMWCTIVYELKLILKFDICETVTDMIVQTHVSLSTKKYDFIICWEFYLRLFVISFWLGRISVAVALI